FATFSFLSCHAAHLHLHSFPTRRSSDLPYFPAGRSWTSAAIAELPFALWLYLGIEQLPLAAEESHDPKRDMPRGILWGLATLIRSEEHTSELQSLAYLVCRLLLEKKNQH